MLVILSAAKDMLFVMSEEEPKQILRCAQDGNLWNLVKWRWLVSRQLAAA